VHSFREEGFAPFIEVNDTACEQYGYTRKELLNLTAKDITVQVDVQQHGRTDSRKRLLSDRRVVFETVHIKKSGETFPVEINSNIIEQNGT
jgi:two-component system, cell cycle sensor histidine kinase and response regulator CckA